MSTPNPIVSERHANENKHRSEKRRELLIDALRSALLKYISLINHNPFDCLTIQAYVLTLGATSFSLHWFCF